MYAFGDGCVFFVCVCRCPRAIEMKIEHFTDTQCHQSKKERFTVVTRKGEDKNKIFTRSKILSFFSRPFWITVTELLCWLLADTYTLSLFLSLSSSSKITSFHFKYFALRLNACCFFFFFAIFELTGLYFLFCNQMEYCTVNGRKVVWWVVFNYISQLISSVWSSKKTSVQIGYPFCK